MTFKGHSRIVMKEVPGRSIAAIWALARVNRTRNRAAREGPLSARQYQHLYQRHHRHLGSTWLAQHLNGSIIAATGW